MLEGILLCHPFGLALNAEDLIEHLRSTETFFEQAVSLPANGSSYTPPFEPDIETDPPRSGTG